MCVSGIGGECWWWWADARKLRTDASQASYQVAVCVCVYVCLAVSVASVSPNVFSITAGCLAQPRKELSYGTVSDAAAMRVSDCVHGKQVSKPWIAEIYTSVP